METLKDELKNIIPLYTILITVIYYFMSRFGQEKQAELSFIHYAITIGLLLITYFCLLYWKGLNNKWLNFLKHLYKLSYLVLGLSIVLIGLLSSGEYNNLWGLFIVKTLMAFIWFLLLLPILSTSVLIFILFNEKVNKNINYFNNKVKGNKESTKKICGIIIITVILSFFAFILGIKFGEVQNKEYVPLIIQSAIFLAGFGFLVLSHKNTKKNNPFHVFIPNVKHIILGSLLSVVFAFLYVVYQNSQVAGIFFKSSAVSLLVSSALVIVLVLFHDNKYLREVEK